MLPLVILAGGFGSRLMEETQAIPKPMVTIGEHPILWHIMRYYSSFGVNHFIILAGYKQNVIKNYFSNYSLYESDVRKYFDVLQSRVPDWTIDILDTGISSLTGSRLRRALNFLPEKFFLTYGDGLSDIKIDQLYEQHLSSNFLLTLSAVLPKGRFGSLVIDDNTVTDFIEKAPGDNSFVNGGFMVVNKESLNYLQDGNVTLEDGLLSNLVSVGMLGCYKHYGFWKPMDTLKDKLDLEELWIDPTCPWKVF